MSFKLKLPLLSWTTLWHISQGLLCASLWKLGLRQAVKKCQCSGFFWCCSKQSFISNPTAMLLLPTQIKLCFYDFIIIITSVIQNLIPLLPHKNWLTNYMHGMLNWPKWHNGNNGIRFLWSYKLKRQRKSHYCNGVLLGQLHVILERISVILITFWTKTHRHTHTHRLKQKRKNENQP